MLVDGSFPHDPVGHPVDDGVVGVGFEKERRPVELDRCVVLLSQVEERMVL